MSKALYCDKDYKISISVMYVVTTSIRRKIVNLHRYVYGQSNIRDITISSFLSTSKQTDV